MIFAAVLMQRNMNLEESCERIIEGAGELFQANGIKAVTMDDIARELGISKRTIYERFKDKDELLMAVIGTMMEKNRARIDSILSSSSDVIAAIFTMLKMGREYAATVNPLIASDLRKYHSAVMARIKEKCENPDAEAAIRLISSGKEQGMFRSDLDAEIVSRFMTSIGQILGDSKSFPPERFKHRDLIRNVFINYLRGISTEKGRQLIEEYEKEI